MTRAGTQSKLFDLPATLPNGLVYRPDFLTPSEEEILIAYIENLPLEHPMYEEYEAKRRIMSFGWGFNFRTQQLMPGPALPPFLTGLQRKIAKWLMIAPERVAEALVTEYTQGCTIGWHVDNESFEKIVGISLGSWCKMRFRPLKRRNEKKLAKDIVALELEPRSAYIMQGPVRWEWQHSVAPVEALRYSITFRTLPPHT
jgi:alkylated DNA repair dioxygenase AlkB